MASSRLKRNSTLAAAVVALVAGFEGLRTFAYRDPVGIPTICFGETRGVRMGDRATAEECKAMLKVRLIEFETGMRSCLRAPDALPVGAYAAFLSFTYNVGAGAFCRSTLASKANAGDIRGACNELPKWTTARGIRLPGLVNRRKAEQAVCLKGLP
jgi:lysozyme